MLNFKNEHLTRQADLIDFAKTQNLPVTIVGCGAIGSFLALSLAKSGFENIELFDGDVISVENMSNQFFRFSDIGKNKSQALSNLVHDFTNIKCKINQRHFTSDDVVARKGVIIKCVDSMDVRKTIFLSLKQKMNYVSYVIDLRMSAEFLALYSYYPSNGKSYEKTLYSDAEAVSERCTAKSTVYTAGMAAGTAVKTLKNYVMNEDILKSLQWDIKSCSPFVCWSHEKN